MNPVQFIRERIWSHLPAEVSFKQRLGAAFLWGVALPFFIGLARWLTHREGGFPWDLTRTLLIYGAVLAVALLIPGLGRHVYLSILRFFALVGFVISTLGLTLIFYVLITPTGWLLRATGKVTQGGKFRGPIPPKWRDYSGDSDPRRYYRRF